MSPTGRGPLSSTVAANWISLQARHSPHRRCLVTADGTVHTFGVVNERVNKLARALRARGIGRGDLIGILATDSVDYMVLLMASMKLGATYVPFNYRLAADELALFARTASLDALVTMARYQEATAAIRAGCPRLRFIASFDDIDGMPRVADLIDEQSDGSDLEVVTQPEDVISIMFTSGTTGNPKGVMQSMRMLENATANALIDFGFGRDELRYSASPMFHAAGMGSVYYGIARGFASLILGQFDPAELLRWLRSGELTGALLMPTMLKALLAQPGVRDQKYPNLRSILYGGAPMSVPLLREALEVFDCAFFNTFGAGTEGAGQTMFYPEDHVRALAGEEHLLGSIGKPMYGVELRLRDVDGRDVGVGEVGEIWTRSNSVMSGYFNDPERTAQAVVDGWFHAGDLAYRDEEGFLFLAGRRSDMIIRGGENVYPVEIETVLLTHPAVDSVAVLGIPDDHWGEVVVAAYEPAAGHSAAAAELAQYCRSRLAAYKVPIQFLVVPSLPRNANGKVQKHLLAPLFGQPPTVGTDNSSEH